MSRRAVLTLVAVVLLIFGAAAALTAWWVSKMQPPPEAPAITEPSKSLLPSRLPAGLADDAETALLETSLQESIARLRLAPDKSMVYGPDVVQARQVADQLQEVLGLVRSGLRGAELVQELTRRYRTYSSAAGEGKVLVTGYYQASLRGSRQRGGAYQTPLYKLPTDLITVDLGLFSEEWTGRKITGLLKDGKLQPMPDRAAIAQGALEGQGLELIWVDDPVDAFFLEIQGSARVQMDDGSVVQVGYAGSSGHPYRAVGKLLIDEGKVPREKMSMQAIRRYLAQHPEEQRRVMDYNPNVVFFQLKTRGPEGSTGAIVTAGRSIATDKSLFPHGGLALLQTSRPVFDAQGERVGAEPLVRLVLNQDTGGAIKGPGRVDFFWGAGLEAEASAGQTKDQGSLYFFAPLPP